MTATTNSAHAGGAATGPMNDQSPRQQISPIGFGTLLRVELRKLVDTRAGLVLLAATGLLLVVVQAIALFTGDADDGKDLADFLRIGAIPLQVLLPIIGILAVTSEWSQRTGLVTFTLVPRRLRVAMSKWVAAIVMALVAVVAGALVAVVFTVLATVVRGSSPSWSVDWQIWLGLVVGMILGVSIGVAFGMLIQNTPGAIVAYFVIPTLWSMLASISWLQNVADWANTDQTLSPLYDGNMSGDDWPKLLVSLIIWLAIPMAAGIWRMTHSEVKSA